MKRWRIGAALVLLIVAACGPASPPSSQSAATSAPAGADTGTAGSSAVEQGELRVLVCCASGEADLKVRDDINKAFQAKFPGVTIKQETLPAGTNYFEKLQTLIAAGTPPDVFDMWEGYVQPYAEAGTLLDLEPYLAVDTELKKDDFDPRMVEVNSWNGKLYSMPIEFVPYPAALFYNKALFDEAGVSYPDENWTWNTMRDAAIKLTKTEGDTTTQWGVLFGSGFPDWLSWIWSNGTDFFNADQTKCNMADPKAIEAIQFWTDLINKDKVAPPAAAVEAFQGSANAFKSGKVAMYFGPGWEPPDFDKTEGLSYGMAVLPKSLQNDRGTYLMNLTWAISSQSKMKQAAWEYVKYFATTGEKDRLSLISSVPSYKPLMSTWLTPDREQRGYAVFLEGQKVAHVPGAGAKWDKISSIAQAELDLVFSGQATAADTAKKICAGVDAELAKS